VVPAAAVATWVALALLARAYRLRKAASSEDGEGEPPSSADVEETPDLAGASRDERRA
jgi:hypothetical protein